MVFVVNHLPIKAGGTISSGTTPLIFTKDSNWLNNYTFQTTNISNFNIFKDLNTQLHVTSINDCGFYSIPITIAKVLAGSDNY